MERLEHQYSRTTFDLQSVLSMVVVGAKMAQKFWELSTNDSHHKSEPTPDTAWSVRTQRLDGPET